jgi:hypothetical protein
MNSNKQEHVWQVPYFITLVYAINTAAQQQESIAFNAYLQDTIDG